MRVDCGQLDPGSAIRPEPGEWHPRMPERPAQRLAHWVSRAWRHWVSIETPEGRVRARVRLNDNLDPRVVVGSFGRNHGV